MNLKKERLKVLQETKDYYSEDTSRRAVVDGTCLYLDRETGNKCAIGRLLGDKIEDFADIDNDVHGIFPNLPMNLKDLGEEFLSDLQEFHDDDIYWDKNGITHQGILKYESIKSDHIDIDD